jgi:hypothetical protein
MNPLAWVDSVRVLSLPHRKDRREKISADLKALGVPFRFHDAVHGVEAFPKLRKGHAVMVANALSISRLLADADVAGEKATLLLEDDAKFIGQVQDLLEAGAEFRPRSAEGIFTYSLGSYPPLGFFFRPDVKRIRNTDSYQASGFYGTHAVVFTPAGRDAWRRLYPDRPKSLVKQILHRPVNPDLNFFTRRGCTGFRKLLFTQNPGMSDIDPRGHTDNDERMRVLFRRHVEPLFD